jgi:hypothetical protein
VLPTGQITIATGYLRLFMICLLVTNNYCTYVIDFQPTVEPLPPPTTKILTALRTVRITSQPLCSTNLTRYYGLRLLAYM